MRKMKDSGIPWLGNIPETWNIAKIKNIANIYVGNSIRDEDKENYSDSGNGIPYIATKDINVDTSIIDYKNGIYTKINDKSFKIANIDSTLMCIEGGSAGKKIAFLEEKVSFVNKLCCFEPKKVNSKYMYYYLKSPAFKIKFDSHLSGLIGGVSQSELKEFPICMPTDAEQIKIANFLDEKIKEIDNAIIKTKETIEDYKKLKKSIITKLVTKGLDKNIEMQDTDSDWIGKIPKHWKYIKIKTLFHAVDERNNNENALLLSLYTAIGVKPRNELEEKGNKAVTVINYKKVKQNDIIVNKLLAWMGAIAYSDYEGVTSPDYDVYRANDNANVFRDYYNAYFRYTNFNGDCYRYGHGIMLMRWRTYPEELLKIKVPNPPYNEQVEISNVIDIKCKEIDKLIENKEKIVEELEQYKKSVIYEYVTGKKEVN